MPAWVVPAVPNGIYRMRVRCAYFTNGPTIQPCNNYGFGETEEYNVYVGTTPNTMTVTLTSNSPVCIGNQININTQVTLAPGSGTCVAAIPSFTYAWTGPMSFTSNVMNPSFTATNVLQSGVYTLNISPGSCGCNSTNTIQIWVNPNPSTSITNNGPVCQGSPLNFTNNVTSSGNVTYSWTGPNSYTNNTQNISFASAQPSLTGTYNFTIVNTFTNNGGSCMAISSSSVAVVPVTQVSVTPSYTQCQGTTINLNANVNGASSYTWNGPGTYTSSLQNPSIGNSTPIMSGDYTVTTYFTSMSTTLVCSSSAVSNVSIVPMNPVTTSVGQNVCQGTNITFTANALGNPIYSWTGPNGFTSFNQSNSINGILPSSAGIYSVNAIFSIGTVSCITSNVTNISVVPVNSISVIPNITLCENTGTQFTANAPGAISYTWVGPNNFNVGAPNPTFINLTPNWSGIYTVTASFTDGSITCYNTNFTNLLVKPIIPFTLTPVNKLCFNDNLLVYGPAGATSYTWTGPNYSSGGQNLYIPNTSTINIGTYYLTVNLNGCETYGSVSVDVQNPIVWKFVPSDLTICKGDKFTVTTEADLGSGNYAYNWNPSYGITGPTGSVQAGTGQGTTIYNVTVYDIACPQYTINHSFKINVNKAPVPNLSVPNYQCEPYCTIYNSKIKDQTELVSYTFNGGNIVYGDSMNICLSSGIYTVDVTSIGLNGCKEVFTYPNMLTIYPKPSANFNWSPDKPNTVSDNNVTFSPINPNNNSTWFWELAANTTTTDKNPTVMYENEGKYPITFMVTSEYGCKDTLTKVLEVKDEFILWTPNAFTPNGDGLNDIFTSKGLGIKKYEMFIFDRWGNQIFHTDDIYKGWDGTYKGTMCSDDVFIYRIVVIDNKSAKHTKTGHVTLLK